MPALSSQRVSWPVLLTLLAFVAALVHRWRRAHGGRIGLDGVVLQGALALGLVGLVGTALAAAGRFGEWELAASTALSALVAWPWWTPRPVGRSFVPDSRARTVVVLGLLLAGLALRLPSIPSALAGRDQGTYTLRALHTLRTGALDLHDPLLAEESRDVASRSGPADVLGLYPRDDSAWRRGVYEAAYRPGFYLTDRDQGHVVPQFLHVHPMLLATGALALGPEHLLWVVLLEGLLALAGLYAVARRLLRSPPWPEAVLALAIASPLLIWVHRVALTESLTAALLAAAVLAVLRSRDGEPRLLGLAAVLLGLCAWVRGNAWISAPVVMAVLLLRPRVLRPGRGGLFAFAALVLGSVTLHAATSFPYLHDELGRLLVDTTGFGAPAIVGAATLIAFSLVGVDLGLTLGLRRPPRRVLRWLGYAPAVFGVAAAIGLWVWVRHDVEGPPFSRLDPLRPVCGVPLLALAAAGLWRVARDWHPRWRRTDVWLLALASIPVVTLLLYARRGIPQTGLYYYGRYLVPELWPAIALAAVHALAVVHRRWSATRPRFAVVAVALLFAAAAWHGSGVLITHPQTRLREHEGAQRAIDELARAIEPDAIVIAGGEGWHHGHTFNQVGGALAIAHGRTLLPYATREAAWATLHELLETRPAATGQPAPPVYLLLNEASRPHAWPDGTPVAGIDDLLPPPFVVESALFVELVTDRLTPTPDAVPTRVTRDALRMALLRVGVAEGAGDDAGRRFVLRGESAERLEARRGVRISGARPTDGRWCLEPDAALKVRLPRLTGPGALVVIAEPGTAPNNDGWELQLDGHRVPLRPPAAASRARDTLGPVPLAAAPRAVSLRGSAREVPGAPCPFGGVAEIRWLAPELARVRTAATTRALTIAPEDELGQPVVPHTWVSSHAVSRYRTGFVPDPAVEVRSFVLAVGRDLGLPAFFAPTEAHGDAVDVVLTLTETSLSSTARIVLRIGDREVARIDPPDVTTSTWQSPATRALLPGRLVRARLEIEGDDDPDHFVHVRDVAWFGIDAPVPSHRVF
jgi:hypothetical protein